MIDATDLGLVVARQHKLEGRPKLEKLFVERSHEHRLATRERETLEESGAKLRQREEALRQREDTFRKQLTEAVDARVRQARREIDEVIEQLKAKAAAIASVPRLVSTGETGAALEFRQIAVPSQGRAPGNRLERAALWSRRRSPPGPARMSVQAS